MFALLRNFSIASHFPFNHLDLDHDLYTYVHAYHNIWTYFDLDMCDKNIKCIIITHNEKMHVQTKNILIKECDISYFMQRILLAP